MSTDSDAFLGKPSASIMLLGTFHFQDAGLDVYKPQFHLDIFSEQRQREVAEVVECLARFQPTKIAVEHRLEHQAEFDRLYAAYVQGEFQLPGSEVYQLGFRLAKHLGHPKVYCVDAWGRYYEPPIDPEIYAATRTTKELEQFLEEALDFNPQRDLALYAEQHNQTHLLSEWWPRFQKSYEHADQAKIQQSLRETLLLGNTEENILKSHGAYLVDWFKLGVGNQYPGADAVTSWYNRNLRIFANLQRITELSNERILLIIGGGHAPILRHCIQASPEYDLIEVDAYLFKRDLI